MTLYIQLNDLLHHQNLECHREFRHQILECLRFCDSDSMISMTTWDPSPSSHDNRATTCMMTPKSYVFLWLDRTTAMVLRKP